MKNIHLNDIVQLSKKINQHFKLIKYKYSVRIKKTDSLDGFALKMLQSQKNISQEKATAKLNTFKKCGTKKTKIHRSSYVEREDQLDLDCYKNIYNLIDTFCKKNYGVKKTIQQFSWDGCRINLSKDLIKNGYQPTEKDTIDNYINLSKQFIVNDSESTIINKSASIKKDCFKTTKNGEIIDGLVIGLYNVTHDYPVMLKLVNHKDERKACLDFLKNTDDFRGHIFLYDRGFVDRKLFKVLYDKDINFVCRVRKNSKLIPTDSNDKIITNEDGLKLRMITYTINDQQYYLTTNLMDREEYTINVLKQMYHNRWGIEEFFKFLKYNTSFGNMNEKNQLSIMKSIYTHLIISRITNILAFIKGNHPNNSKQIINKAVLINGIYDDLLLKFLYNKHISLRTLRQFMNIYVVYQATRTGCHYERKSITPYTKWYIKKYFEKYKLKKIIKKLEEKLEKIINSSIT